SSEDSASHTTALRVIDLSAAVAIASGEAHTCAVRRDGTSWCWGANGSGQLGRGTQTLAGEAGMNFALRGIVSVSAGGDHTCVLRENGVVLCWGDNRSGQLGDGTTESRSSPVAVVW